MGVNVGVVFLLGQSIFEVKSNLVLSVTCLRPKATVKFRIHCSA